VHARKVGGRNSRQNFDFRCKCSRCDVASVCIEPTQSGRCWKPRAFCAAAGVPRTVSFPTYRVLYCLVNLRGAGATRLKLSFVCASRHCTWPHLQSQRTPVCREKTCSLWGRRRLLQAPLTAPALFAIATGAIREACVHRAVQAACARPYEAVSAALCTSYKGKFEQTCRLH
jgi:hypothetical protein